MTEQDTASGKMEATTEQDIGRLATEIMKWNLEIDRKNYNSHTGHLAWYDQDHNYICRENEELPWNPRTDWNHTWQLLKKWQQLGFYYELTNSYHSKPASCRIWDRKAIDITEYGEQQESICKAVLLALDSLSSKSE